MSPIRSANGRSDSKRRVIASSNERVLGSPVSPSRSARIWSSRTSVRFCWLNQPSRSPTIVKVIRRMPEPAVATSREGTCGFRTIASE